MKKLLYILGLGLLFGAQNSLAQTDTGSGEVAPACYQDLDCDQIPDYEDNCIEVPNENQLDTDLDGYGNKCDMDWNNDGLVSGLDFGPFLEAFGARSATGEDAELDRKIEFFDYDQNGFVTTLDFSGFISYFNKEVGPSGLECAGTVPCTTFNAILSVTENFDSYEGREDLWGAPLDFWNLRFFSYVQERFSVGTGEDTQIRAQLRSDETLYQNYLHFTANENLLSIGASRLISIEFKCGLGETHGLGEERRVNTHLRMRLANRILYSSTETYVVTRDPAITQTCIIYIPGNLDSSDIMSLEVFVTATRGEGLVDFRLDDYTLRFRDDSL